MAITSLHYIKKKGDRVSQDFFAMLDFLKKDITRNEIKRELHIAGMTDFFQILMNMLIWLLEHEKSW